MRAMMKVWIAALFGAVLSLGAIGLNESDAALKSAGFNGIFGGTGIFDAITLDSTNQDTKLVRDAANALALRNGTNAQKECIYNTSAAANANFERFCIDWQSTANVLKLVAEKGGTGTDRGIRISSSGGGIFAINEGNLPSVSWAIQSSNHLLPGSDISFDIGQVANRVRAIYATSYSTGPPVSNSGTTYTVAVTDTYLINTGGATQTLTLPAAATFTGRRLVVKTTTAFTVVSATSNVVPQAGGAAGTAILAATAGKYAELVSDGTNWITFAAN